MVYKLRVSRLVESKINRTLDYLHYDLNNVELMTHLSDCIYNTYVRIQENPLLFPRFYFSKYVNEQYRKALIQQTKYLFIYKIVDDVIEIIYFAHQSEDYSSRIF